MWAGAAPSKFPSAAQERSVPHMLLSPEGHARAAAAGVTSATAAPAPRAVLGGRVFSGANT